MNRITITFVSALVLSSACQLAYAASPAVPPEKHGRDGEKLHEQHCFKCHTDSVYTRENRFVRSLDALSKQVKRCKNNLGVPWFDEDTKAVVHFLNEKYYKF